MLSEKNAQGENCDFTLPLATLVKQFGNSITFGDACWLDQSGSLISRPGLPQIDSNFKNV